MAQLINQVKCEVASFLNDNKAIEAESLRLDEELPAQIDMSFTTDELGNLTFTAIDLKRMGFDSLAALIAAKAPPKDLTPVLSASGQGRGVRSVAVSVAIPQTGLQQTTEECQRQNPLRDPNKLYIKDWLLTYVNEANDLRVGNSTLVRMNQAQTIDMTQNPKKIPIKTELSPKLDANGRYIYAPDTVLTQIQLNTEFHVIVDISAGINAFKFTGPSAGAYVIPTQASPTLQVKADYYHKLTITLKGKGAAGYLNTKLERDLMKQKSTPFSMQERNLKLLIMPPVQVPSTILQPQ